MAHMLEMIDGKASFAYDVNGGNPWHRLGTSVEGAMTIMEGLSLSGADYTIHSFPVCAAIGRGRNQKFIELPNRRVTMREHPLAGQPIPEEATADRTMYGTVYPPYIMLGIVAERDYHISQNEQLLVFAYALIGADRDSNGETGRAIDTIGVLNDGKRFFATLKQPQAIKLLLANGAADIIDEFLIVHSRHDGHGATNLFESRIRAVCNNTVTAGENAASAMFTLSHRHDLDAKFEELLQEARASMNGTTVDDELAQLAAAAYGPQLAEFNAKVEASREAMAQEAFDLSKVTVNRGVMKKVIDTMWPVDVAELTKRQQTIRANRDQKMMDIFESDRCAGAYGDNGWSALQAIGEYFDHHHVTTSEVGRTVKSLFPASTNQTWKIKEVASQVLLNGAWRDGALPEDTRVLIGSIN